MKKLNLVRSLALVIAAVGATSLATAFDRDNDRDGDRDQALVLGDSVAFAYIKSAGYEYVNPRNFVGFADELAATARLEVVDAACPGETTGSFLVSGAPDNGCQAYRQNFPLHVAYRSTQLDFAKHYLTQHRRVRLVTLTLGANDGFLLEERCSTDVNCILAGLQVTGANLALILSDLRATGYGGPIVVTNYYSTDYTDQQLTELTVALNEAIAAPASAFGARVADVFTAFQQAAVAFGNSPCAAGLLNVANPSVANPPYAYTCDIHPTESGHRLIAGAIFRALR
jgi:lysophospholipase L1-like esterase